MAQHIYLAHPRGAHRGEWRGVVNGFPDGFKIHYFACCLAEMAVEAGCGGLLRHGVGGAGAPMEPEFIATALGADFGWARTVLFPALEHIGEGNWDQNGGWVCTSPMATHTLSWQAGESRPKALPPGQDRAKAGRPAIFSGIAPADAAYEAIYKKWQRTCQLPEGVTLAGACPKFQKGLAGCCLILSEKVGKCPNKCPKMSENNKRTNEVEDADIVDEIECPEIDKQSKGIESKKAAAGKQTAAASSGKTKTVENLCQGIEAAIAVLPTEIQAMCREKAAEKAEKGLAEAAVEMILRRIPLKLKTAKNALSIVNFMFGPQIEKEVCAVLEEAEVQTQQNEAQREAEARRQGEAAEKLAAEISRNRLQIQKRLICMSAKELAEIDHEAEEWLKDTGPILQMQEVRQIVLAEKLRLNIGLG